MLDTLEDMFNDVSDSNAAWWPFVFLRPSKHARISGSRSLLLALLYGVFIGLLINIVMKVAPGADGAQMSPLFYPLEATLLLFGLHRSSFAYFWNRRAARLARSRVRHEAWMKAKEDLDEAGELPEED